MSPSIVWKHFTKNNNGTATCQLCQKTLKTSGNTSNLNGHLTSKHSSVMVSKAKSTATPRQEFETSDVDDQPVTLSILSTASTSTSNMEPAFKRQKTISESFSQIVSYQHGGFKSEKLVNAILYMIAKDNQPLSIVENKGFINLMNVSSPNFKIPSRRDISRRLEGKYNSFQDLFKNELNKVKYISLTMDIWTDIHTQSYLGVTVHFEKNNKLASGLLGVIDLQERHTSQYIADTLNEVCKQWDISLETITANVTDGAANITKAVDLLFGNPNKPHTMLRPHIKLVASDELRKVSNSKLIQEVPTRWNSTFYMLERFIALRRFINDIVNRNISAPPMVCAKDIEEIIEIITVLRPLEAATKELCGEQYVSSSMVIPIVHLLETKIDEATTTQILSNQLKNALKLKCSKRLGQIENVTFLAIATILDPRFKRLYFKNSVSLSKMLTKISEEIKSYEETSESSSDSSDSSQNTEYSLWNNHEKIVQQSSRSRGRAKREEIGYPSELNLYFKSAVGRLTDNPLLLWKDMSTVYPNIVKVALKYLSTVATSVPSERLFSKAGLTMNQQRNRLTSKKLNMLLFLQSVDESFWELNQKQVAEHGQSNTGKAEILCKTREVTDKEMQEMTTDLANIHYMGKEQMTWSKNKGGKFITNSNKNVVKKKTNNKFNRDNKMYKTTECYDCEKCGCKNKSKKVYKTSVTHEITNNEVSAFDEFSVNEITEQVCNIDANQKSWIEEIKIGKMWLKFKLDTGSDINIIPYDDFIKKNMDVFTELGQFPELYNLELVDNFQSKIVYYRTVPIAVKDRYELKLKLLIDQEVVDYFFMVLDLKDGFWQIGLTESSSNLCSFASPIGNLKFKKIPFELKIAPSVFQRFNTKYFGDIKGFIIYFDDFIIAADTKQEHDNIVEELLNRARKYNVKFNKEKIQYCKDQVTFLGHLFDQKGMSLNPSRIEAVKKLKPNNKKELQRLLGLINYLRSFIPNFSELTTPLRNLLKKDTEWQWTSSQML
ncbi:hypothetical protein QTP88_010302 [Uroleucon formosanum]